MSKHQGISTEARLAARFITVVLDQNGRMADLNTRVPQANTYTNRIYIARLTDCPGALTNVKMRDKIAEFLKDFTIY